MALSLQDNALVWRKVDAYFANTNTSGKGATPAAIGAFKALKDYRLSVALTAQLQFVPFSEADADDECENIIVRIAPFSCAR